jgi:hypothetical protein
VKRIKDIIFFDIFEQKIGTGWQEWAFEVVILRRYTLGFTFTKELR